MANLCLFSRPKPTSPFGILCYDNILYITCYGNNTLSMYTINGEYICSVGDKSDSNVKFGWPQHIAMDSDGYLYVCDHASKCILKL